MKVKSNSHDLVPDSLFHDLVSIIKGTSARDCDTINIYANGMHNIGEIDEKTENLQ